METPESYSKDKTTRTWVGARLRFKEGKITPEHVFISDTISFLSSSKIYQYIILNAGLENYS